VGAVTISHAVKICELNLDQKPMNLDVTRKGIWLNQKDGTKKQIFSVIE